MAKISELNYFAVGRDDTYARKSDGYDYESTPEQIDKIVEHLLSNNVGTLNLYFHGGLVGEGVAENSINHVFGEIGKNNVPHSHNLACIWNTSLWDTLRSEWSDILGDYLTEDFLKNFTDKFLRRLGVKRLRSAGLPYNFVFGLAQSDVDAVDLSRSDIDFFWNDPFESGEAYFDLIDGAVRQSIMRLDSIGALDSEQDFVESIGGELSDSLIAPSSIASFGSRFESGNIAWNIILRFKNNTDHGLHATIIEEVLRSKAPKALRLGIWGEMKERAERMWVESGKIGFDLIAKLKKGFEDSGKRLNINLVGHSAGAICICHFLEFSEKNNWTQDGVLQVNKIAFWAPAARYDLFDKSIVQKPHRYKHFRMFTMKDKNEKKDELIDVKILNYFYPSSLLYFISGVLEAEPDSPLCGMARYHSGRKPYASEVFVRVKQFLSQPKYRVLSKTDASAEPGLQCTATDHGWFSRNPETTNSLAFYLKE